MNGFFLIASYISVTLKRLNWIVHVLATVAVYPCDGCHHSVFHCVLNGSYFFDAEQDNLLFDLPCFSIIANQTSADMIYLNITI